MPANTTKNQKKKPPTPRPAGRQTRRSRTKDTDTSTMASPPTTGDSPGSPANPGTYGGHPASNACHVGLRKCPVTSVETAAGPTTGVGVPTAGSAEDVAPNVPGGAILAAVVPGPSTPTLSREDLEEMLRNLQAQLGMIQQTPGQAVTPAAPVQSTVPNPTVTAAPANVSVPPTRSPAPHMTAAQPLPPAVPVPMPVTNTVPAVPVGPVGLVQTHAGTQRPVMIPRPKGTPGEDYNLQEAMGLANNQALYGQIKSAVRDYVRAAQLDVNVRWNYQDKNSLSKIMRLARINFPYLQQFVHDWPVDALAHAYCKRRRNYLKKLQKAAAANGGVVPATFDEMESSDDDAP
ncbi:hypothetical protein C8Q72DRAFT_951906 [Fomitopsis betulina]|nr:hypothetical protein C8Q72DRAFT_951906 [Fomitopsis betulina]